MTSYSMSERVGWRAGDLLWLITAVHVCLTPTTSQNKKRPLGKSNIIEDHILPRKRLLDVGLMLGRRRRR